MSSYVQRRAPLGELVAATFEEAAFYSVDPQVVARLATSALMNVLRRRAPKTFVSLYRTSMRST